MKLILERRINLEIMRKTHKICSFSENINVFRLTDIKFEENKISKTNAKRKRTPDQIKMMKNEKRKI